MALKAVLSSLEGLDESLHNLYTEKDGKFYLDVEGLGPDAQDTHPAVSGLKSALDREREAKEQFEADLKKLEPLKDLDPEEYKRLKREAEERRDKEMVDAGKVDELVDEKVTAIKQGMEEEKTELSNQVTTLKGQVKTLVVATAVQSAAGTAKVKPKATGTLVNLAYDAGWEVANDGKTPILKRDGKTVYGKSGEPITPKEWIEGEVREDHDYLFEGSTGGGSQDGGGGDPPPASFKPSSASDKEVSEYIEKYGSEAYENAVEKEVAANLAAG